MKKKIILILILLVALIYLNNSSIFVKQQVGAPLLLAHRGAHQTFSMEGITGSTNTAQRIYQPEHSYLENTIPSMEEAFRVGADIVEFDIHPTTDGQFAVFHDWILEYRTNGEGATREHSMEELKILDIGYGYTADNGETFPFRGKGIGLMPSLDEVLTHFPDRAFLIHIKSNDPQEGERLLEYLKALPEERLERLAVYGGDQPIALLEKGLPNLRVMSKETLKKALLSYMAIGWTGYIPSSMRGAQLHIPEKYARLLWGWPYRFLRRMEKVDTRVILVKGDGRFSEGFDTIEDLKKIPLNFTGGIWTNRIDRIGPVYHYTIDKR